MHRKVFAPALAAALVGLAATGPALAAADVAKGEELYNQTCIACHGADGTGTVPGAPDFTKAGGPLSKPDEVLVKNIIEGFQSPGSPMAMPAKGGNAALTKDGAEALVEYLRQRFAP